MSGAALKISPTLAAALAYAARNWRVFPLHTARDGKCSCRADDCKSKGKHPRNSNGCTGATTDTAQIHQWWAQWPDANVGVATGNGLVVIDIDPRHNGDESLAALEPFPETPRVLTGGGGQHIYLTTAVPIRSSAGQLGPGIDVRGDGGYVVAPPERARVRTRIRLGPRRRPRPPARARSGMASDPYARTPLSLPARRRCGHRGRTELVPNFSRRGHAPRGHERSRYRRGHPRRERGPVPSAIGREGSAENRPGCRATVPGRTARA